MPTCCYQSVVAECTGDYALVDIAQHRKFLRISASLMGSNEMDVSAANRKLLIELVIGTVTFLDESG
jgi:hypothetical protein